MGRMALLLLLLPLLVTSSVRRLESVEAEVCSQGGWWDGPGTDSQLLLHLASGASSCYTAILRGSWLPGAVLAFEGRWGGVRQCRLELGERPSNVTFRVVLRNDTWRSGLLGMGDGDDLCLRQVNFQFFGDSKRFVWRASREGRVWNWSLGQAEVAVREDEAVSSLARLTAVTCPAARETIWDGAGTGDAIRLEVSSLGTTLASCSTPLLLHSVSGFPPWSSHGASIFTGLRPSLCRLPLSTLGPAGLAVRLVKEDRTYGPDELCLAFLKLDFTDGGGSFSWAGEQWVHNEENSAVVAQDLGTFLGTEPLEMVARGGAEAGRLVKKEASQEPLCRQVTLHCPDTVHSLTTLSCCSMGSCYLKSAPDIARYCPLYSCYYWDAPSRKFGSENGCSVVPNSWLSREACVIHDLCYMTPLVRQEDCDQQMRDNTNSIHWDNTTGPSSSYHPGFPEVALSLGFQYLGVGDAAFQESQFLSKHTQCRMGPV